MKKLVLTLSAAAVAVLAVPAKAQFQKPEDAILYRQSAFVLMGNHMGRINAQLRSDKPNVQVIQSSAALIADVSKLPFEAFTPGTETGGARATRVKAEAFKDGPKVKELADKMIAEVAKLETTAKGGDVAAIRAQFGEVGKTCKACHDNYRRD